MRKSDERFLNWEAQRISHIFKRLVTHRMHSRKLNDWREPQARLMRNARHVNHVINRPNLNSALFQLIRFPKLQIFGLPHPAGHAANDDRHLVSCRESVLPKV